MAKLSASASHPIKAIIAAESGTGKTGALWSLADRGFKLRIYDADRGTPILASILKDNPKAMDRVEVNSFTDELTRDAVSGYSKPKGKASAWPRLTDALNKWPDDPEGKGAGDWGPDTVVVIDSLTLFSKAALRYAMQMEGFGKGTAWKPALHHYGTAMPQIEGLFALLYSDAVQCHVIWLTHVRIEEDEEGGFIGAFPSTIGKALNPVIPRYVNDILSIKVAGNGPTAKRFLVTKPTTNRIVTKTSELGVRDEYLLADGRTPKPGLAEFFADNGWEGPNG